MSMVTVDDVVDLVKSNDITPSSFHWHVCEACFHIWGHEPLKPGEDMVAAHRCPVCACGPYRVGFRQKQAVVYAAISKASDDTP